MELKKYPKVRPLLGRTRELALTQLFPHDEGGEAGHLRLKLSSVSLLVEEGQKANDVSFYERFHGTKVANQVATHYLSNSGMCPS